MDARKLRYFVTVAQLGSFSEAARRLHIAQPALSRHVKAIEESLGVELLTRDARGVCPTEAGEQLLLHGRDVLERLEQLPRMVGSRSHRVAGRVVVGLPTSASAVLSVPLLRAALERYPLVRIHLMESLSGTLEEWMEAGRLDLAVLYDAQPLPGIALEPVLVEDLWLVGGPNAFPASRKEVAFRTLPRYRLVVPSLSHSHRRLVEGLALSHNVRLEVAAEIDSLSVQKAMVADGSTFTIVPHGAIHTELAAGTLSALRIVSPSISRTVSLACALTRSDSQACNAIARLMLDLARGLVRTNVWQGRADFGPQDAADA